MMKQVHVDLNGPVHVISDSGTDWVTLSLVLVTTVMAIATVYLGCQTRKSVVEVKRATQAAEVEAEATRAMVTEIQRDRQLAYAPYLVFEPSKDDPAILAVSNIGRGPAVDCRACQSTRANSWTLTGPFAVGPNQTLQMLRGGMKGQPPGAGVPILPDIADTVFCKDQFGNMYRFDDGGAHQDTLSGGDMTIGQDAPPGPMSWSVIWEHRQQSTDLVISRER